MARVHGRMSSVDPHLRRKMGKMGYQVYVENMHIFGADESPSASSSDSDYQPSDTETDGKHAKPSPTKRKAAKAKPKPKTKRAKTVLANPPHPYVATAGNRQIRSVVGDDGRIFYHMYDNDCLMVVSTDFHVAHEAFVN